MIRGKWKKEKKKSNLVEIDDQTLFLLKLEAERRESPVPWVHKGIDNVIRDLVEENLVPQDSVLYEKVMTIVTDAMLTGERDDYRTELLPLFDFARRSLNLNKDEISEIAIHTSPRLMMRPSAALNQFPELGTGMTARNIVTEMADNWEKYRYNPAAYELIGELIRYEYVDNPVSLSFAKELYTVVTMRPFNVDKSEKPSVEVKGIFDDSFDKDSIIE